MGLRASRAPHHGGDAWLLRRREQPPATMPLSTVCAPGCHWAVSNQLATNVFLLFLLFSFKVGVSKHVAALHLLARNVR